MQGCRASMLYLGSSIPTPLQSRFLHVHYILVAQNYLLFSNVPLSLFPLGADPSTVLPLLFNGYHLIEFNQNSLCRTFSHIALRPQPSLLLKLTPTCVTPYCSTLHTSFKQLIYISAFPTQISGLLGNKDHDLPIFVSLILSLEHG